MRWENRRQNLGGAQVVAATDEIRVVPDPARADIHYRGDGRGLLTQVAAVFGVTATFDESVVSRQVRFEIGRADFYTAMAAACQMTHTFWTPLGRQADSAGSGIGAKSSPV